MQDWEARYEKGRCENGRISYGYVYAHTYDEVKKKRNLALQQVYFCFLQLHYEHEYLHLSQVLQV